MNNIKSIVYSISDLKKDLQEDYCRNKKISNERLLCSGILSGILTFSPIIIFRFGHYIHFLQTTKKKVGCLFFELLFFIFEYVSVVIFKVSILSRAQIGPGLVLSKKGNIIIGADKIGKNCTIGHNVTVGMGIGFAKNDIRPEIGDNVIIGSNTLIFGSIKVGSNTIIKSSTVLSRNVPDGSLVEGNPARILKLND